MSRAIYRESAHIKAISDCIRSAGLAMAEYDHLACARFLLPLFSMLEKKEREEFKGDREKIRIITKKFRKKTINPLMDPMQNLQEQAKYLNANRDYIEDLYHRMYVTLVDKNYFKTQSPALSLKALEEEDDKGDLV